MKLFGFEVIEDSSLKTGDLYITPKLEGLTVKDGKIQIATQIPVHGKG